MLEPPEAGRGGVVPDRGHDEQRGDHPGTLAPELAAVQEARAALYHDPRHLFSWFLFGKELIAVDDARGRRVLEELLQHVSGLPPEGEILSAPGLSAGQMVAATRLLLGEEP